jgi:hypothetical protein
MSTYYLKLLTNGVPRADVLAQIERAAVWIVDEYTFLFADDSEITLNHD